MAISFVGGATFTKTGSTSGTLTCPLTSLTGGSDSAPSPGDLVVVLYGTGSLANRLANITVTDGTTAYGDVSANYVNGSGRDLNVRLAYKFMGSPADASFVVGPTGSNGDGGAIVVMVFRGVDQSNPLDVSRTLFSAVTGTPVVDPAAITPVTAGAWILVAGGVSGTTVSTFTSSDLTGMTTVAATGTRKAAVGMAYYTGWTGGSFDPAAWSGGGGADGDGYGAITFALRPAVAAINARWKTWSGSAWVAKPVKVWNGSAWVEKQAKVWNGTTWVLL